MVESIECCRLEIIRFASQCKDDEPWTETKKWTGV